jgi:Glycosyl hydrolases family 39
MKRCGVIIVLALTLSLGAAEPELPQNQPSGASPEVTFRDFIGVNYPAPSAVSQQLGIGWIRDGFPWGGVEPQKGQWNWEATDKEVKNAQAQSLGFLPLLAYTAPWAESIAGKDKSPPKSVQDWEDFVEHVVARYSSPPFNLRYFQVWNEPTRHAGFWLGTDQQFVDLVYVPAAKIIRRHNCFVVFGGWPLSNSLQQFDQLLTYHDAWRWTDIVDVHYQNPPAWQHLYDQWIRTRKCHGIWETEIGHTGDPDYLPTTYLRLLNWALQSGWHDPNQYKVFWFAIWGNAKDRLGHLTRPVGKDYYHLTQNGIELKTMNDVLGGGSLSSFTQFTTRLPRSISLVPNAPSVFGLRVGTSRVVIALLVNQAVRQGTSAIPIQISINRKPQQVQLVSVDGDRKPLGVDYQGGRLNVNLAQNDLKLNCPTCKWAVAYVQIDGL